MRGMAGDAALVVEPEQLACGGGEFRTGVKGDGRQVEIDPVEHGGQCGHRHTGVADGQPQGGDAGLQIGEHGLVDARRVGARVALAYVPAGDRAPLRPAAPGEGCEAGISGRGRGVVGNVVGGVQRTGDHPVLKLRGECLLGGRTFDVPAGLAQHA